MMNILPGVGRFLGILKKSFAHFARNEPLRMAAATSFFATFALPAILIILIQIFGLVLDPRFLSKHLFDNLSEIIGHNTVLQLRQTLQNVRGLAQTWWIAAGGFLFLIFVSTTLFKVIKDSLNQLWSLKIKEGPGIALRLEHRVKALLAILLTGVLFLAVLLGEALLTILREYVQESAPHGAFYLSGFLRQLISLLVVTAWFTMIFKFLPDGRPSWKTALTGAFFTGLLFTGGKLLIRWLLSYSNMHTIYGASTSMVLLLLFVFYSSFIFYYGACFTRIWAEAQRRSIPPGKNAVKYKLSVAEIGES